MRRLLLFLVVLFPLTTIASAQSTAPFNPNHPAVFAVQRAAAALNPDMVVARMMMFDRDLDGRVTKGELPERMQNLLLGDVSGDQALDKNEIRGLARSAPAVAAATVPGLRTGGGGGYMFGDEASLSTRSHVEGVLEDLRLPASTHQHALAIVEPFMDRLEADASSVLFKELEGLLAPGQLSAFRVAIDRRMSLRTAAPPQPQTITRPDGIKVTTFFRGGPDPAQLFNAFGLHPDQNRAAHEAFEAFKARIRPGDADRAALLDELKDVLSGEDLEDFGAALQRRPLVKANGLMAGVVSGVVGGREVIQRIGGVEGPVFFAAPSSPPKPVVAP